MRGAGHVAHRRLLASGREARGGRSGRRRRTAPSRRSRPAAPVATEDAPERPLDWHGTRRAPRLSASATGVEMQLDGNPATVDRSVGVRRAGDLADGPAAEPEGPHQHSDRRLRDALPRRRSPGPSSSCRKRRCRPRSTAPASSSPTAIAAAIDRILRPAQALTQVHGRPAGLPREPATPTSARRSNRRG